MVQSKSRARSIRIALAAVIFGGLVLIVLRTDGQQNARGNTLNYQSANTQAAAKSNNAFFKAVCSTKTAVSSPGELATEELREASGIAASRRAENLYWLHNDSGDDAKLYAISGSAQHVGSFTLKGAQAKDWEDIAVGPGPTAGISYIYVGDIGDNAESRKSVTVYRLPEPDPKNPDNAIADYETLIFTYPDGSHNTEALAVDPTSGKLYLFTKSEQEQSMLYEAPDGLQDGTTTMLTRLGPINLPATDDIFEQVTAADIAPSGGTILVRTYDQLYVFDRPENTSVKESLGGHPCAAPKIDEQQGEAAAFTSKGDGIISVSEGSDQPFHYTKPY